MVEGDSSRIQMQAGAKLILALVVVGEAPGSVVFAGENLPSL